MSAEESTQEPRTEAANDDEIPPEYEELFAEILEAITKLGFDT